MTTEKLSAANAIVRNAIDDAVARGVETGVQVAAYLNGELVVDTWGGIADDRTGRPVDGDTLFNVYSVTNAVAATALHIQADRGLIDYDAPITRYWPEYGANGKGGTTVREGGSIGWADPDTRLAVAICHNRLFNASAPEEDPLLPIANAVREAVGPGVAD